MAPGKVHALLAAALLLLVVSSPLARAQQSNSNSKNLYGSLPMVEERSSEEEAESTDYLTAPQAPLATGQHVSTLLHDPPSVISSCDPEDVPEEPPQFPTFKVTGFFHLDSGFYHQSPLNIETLGDIEDGTGFRRARLGVTGNVSEDTSYMMEYDFAQFQGRFVDVWMQFANTPAGNVRIGRFRQPFGMTELTGVRDLPFIERPTLFALAPFRQTDVSPSERMTWAIAGYRFLSDNFGNVYGDSGGFGMATRVTALPIDWGDEQLLHLGFGYSYNDPARNEVQFASTNEFFVGQNPNLGPGGLSVLPVVGVPPFVTTGAMPTDHVSMLNVEAATNWGGLVVQSEARWAVVDLESGESNTFPGAYIHARYVLTGEKIPDNRATGTFGRVKPTRSARPSCGEWGAWEIAARLSYLDLNGDGLPGPGRSLTDTTLGLNWYVNNFTKFQFNWIHADLRDLTVGHSYAETFAVRGQIDF
jgi:phosphate-selective porin OprO/OprP